VLVAARDGTVVHVSDGFCRLMGRSREEMLGRQVTDFGMAAGDRLAWVLERLPASGQGYRYASRIGTAAGPRAVVVELHAVVTRREELIVATLEPVESGSEDDADVLAMVLDQAPVGVVVYDAELRIVRVNPRVEDMGRIKPSHIGMRLEDVLPDVNPLVVGAIRQVFRSGDPMLNLEVSGIGGQGAFLLNLFPIHRRGGPIEAVACIFSDVSDRVAAEQALAESERRRREILAAMLQAEEDERGRIATELHDDTVQVMAATLLALDQVATMARSGDPERIEQSVTHARTVLKEATERTRRLMFELRPAILHEHGLRDAVAILTEQAGRETGADVRLECPSARYDHTIEELLYRTIQEALANVRKHANPAMIRVAIGEARGGMLHCEVSDDGRGFDLDQVLRRPGAALHLGLESMRERIRIAGGGLTIATTPGGGTRVTFAVPLSAGLEIAPRVR
jgi:signal transduction histidine kinase